MLTRLILSDFRNIASGDLTFSPGVNLLMGENAQGKTNILESVFLCATGRSHRTRFDSQMVRFGQKEAHLRAYVSQMGREDRIDVHLRREGKKGVAVNGIAVRRSGELFGTLYTVLFSPEDLQLIKLGPQERRRFMDLELCQLSRVYYYHLQQYHKVLKQRNQLLKTLQKQRNLLDTLPLWEEQMARFAAEVIHSRQAFVDKLSDVAGVFYQTITGGREHLSILYRPNCRAEELQEKWLQSLERDIFSGATGHGPHKDDLQFFVDGNDVKLFGSQGQQRTAALSAKLAEIALVQEETGQNPVLLLDDVFSELDEGRQRFLVQAVVGLQTILTCTGVEGPVSTMAKQAKIFSINNGKISVDKF